MKPPQSRPFISCDFWFFAVIAVAVYFGGDALRLLTAAMVHEAGHCLALLASDNKILQLKLCGCRAQIIPHYRRLPGFVEELAILASGPLAGLVLAALFRPVAPRFARANLLLSAFNLLPVRGLDGGSILRLICRTLFNSEKTAAADIIGGITAIGMFAAGIWSLIFRRPNIPLLGLALFLLLSQFYFADSGD